MACNLSNDKDVLLASMSYYSDLFTMRCKEDLKFRVYVWYHGLADLKCTLCNHLAHHGLTTEESQRDSIIQPCYATQRLNPRQVACSDVEAEKRHPCFAVQRQN